MIKKYRVKSETDNKTTYIVRYFGESGRLVCTCPDYTFNKEGHECKHILKVKSYLEAQHDKKNRK